MTFIDRQGALKIGLGQKKGPKPLLNKNVNLNLLLNDAKQ